MASSPVEPIAVDAPTIAGMLGISERTLRSDAWNDCPRLVRGGRVVFVVEAVRRWAVEQSKPAEKQTVVNQ